MNIVAARRTGGFHQDLFHYVKAGGGSTRSSICGKEVANAKRGWLLGKGGLRACDDCVRIAESKYGVHDASGSGIPQGAR